MTSQLQGSTKIILSICDCSHYFDFQIIGYNFFCNCLLVRCGQSRHLSYFRNNIDVHEID